MVLKVSKVSKVARRCLLIHFPLVGPRDTALPLPGTARCLQKSSSQIVNMLSNGSDTGASSISLEDFSDEVTIEAVETLVQYKFHDSALLWEALHTQGPTPDGNKRLAIVDDSVLALALSEDWYRGKTTRGK